LRQRVKPAAKTTAPAQKTSAQNAAATKTPAKKAAKKAPSEKAAAKKAPARRWGEDEFNDIKICREEGKCSSRW